ncbi:hypothetical protein AMYX_07600 [Anaeromyxobacter diazotrophicus]|uniref:Methyltransferase type 11 domain-containing protein n=1 Tax=Anaeromyxobacter diazotrophicus TaxID=2590199 RepID=A0A7I9VID7_9BACT|nr:hypothetical protein AMYX_07600 [Anaeromyxobacter diazotrophicus]
MGLGCAGCREAAAVSRRVGPAGLVVMVVTSGDDALELPPAPRPALIVRGAVAATGLRAGLADVVVSSCPAGGRADPSAMYRELHRILKPGGRLVASDVVAPHPARIGGYRPGRADGTIPEPEYLAVVRAAGFERLRVLQGTAPYEADGRLVQSLTLEAVRG